MFKILIFIQSVHVHFFCWSDKGFEVLKGKEFTFVLLGNFWWVDLA